MPDDTEVQRLAALWLTPSGEVAVDLRCVQCGYNLRTLHADAKCVECGRAVRESAPLVTAEPAELRRARLGYALMAACCLALVVLPLVAMLLQQLHPTAFPVMGQTVGGGWGQWLAQRWGDFAYPAILLIALIGSFTTARSLPEGVGRSLFRGFNFAAIVILGVYLATSIVDDWRYSALWSVMSSVGAFVGLLALLAALGRARELFAAMPSPKLANCRGILLGVAILLFAPFAFFLVFATTATLISGPHWAGPIAVSVSTSPSEPRYLVFNLDQSVSMVTTVPAEYLRRAECMEKPDPVWTLYDRWCRVLPSWSFYLANLWTAPLGLYFAAAWSALSEVQRKRRAVERAAAPTPSGDSEQGGPTCPTPP
jgi:hypothetical protein